MTVCVGFPFLQDQFGPSKEEWKFQWLGPILPDITIKVVEVIYTSTKLAVALIMLR